MTHGTLIVLEGIDGSGKATQSAHLEKKLNNLWYNYSKYICIHIFLIHLEYRQVPLSFYKLLL